MKKMILLFIVIVLVMGVGCKSEDKEDSFAFDACFISPQQLNLNGNVEEFEQRVVDYQGEYYDFEFYDCGYYLDLNAEVSFDYDDYEVQITSFDEEGDKISKLEYIYDAKGYLLEEEYKDPEGKMVFELDTKAGRVKMKNGVAKGSGYNTFFEENYTSEFTFEKGMFVKEIDWLEGTDVVVWQLDYEYNSKEQMITASTTYEGYYNIKKFDYNRKGFLENVIVSNSDYDEQVTYEYEYEYDSHGNWVECVAHKNGIYAFTLEREYKYN